MRSACTKAVVGVAEQAGEIASSIHAPNDCVVDVTRQRQGAVWGYSEYELRPERCIEDRAAGQGEGTCNARHDKALHDLMQCT